MIINKITVGYVVQTFDTEKMEWIGQKFVAGDDYVQYDAEYETETGDDIPDEVMALVTN